MSTDVTLRITRETAERIQGIQSAMGFKNKNEVIDFLLDKIPQQDFLRLISSKKESEKLDKILDYLTEIKRDIWM